MAMPEMDFSDVQTLLGDGKSDPKKFSCCPCTPQKCLAITCFSGAVVTWLTLTIMYLVFLSTSPAFCNASVPPKLAAAEELPSMFGSEIGTNWTMVATGWNEYCGPPPPEGLDALAKNLGLGPVIKDASGFQNSEWTKYDFRLFHAVELLSVAGFPCGSRPQNFRTMSQVINGNLFFMPTAVMEHAAFMTAYYAPCAYIKNPDGGLPNQRLFRTVKSPFGQTPVFYQNFSRGDAFKFEYHVVSEDYNDNPPGNGALKFIIAATETGCFMWSTRPEAYPMELIMAVLSIGIIAVTVLVARAFKWF